MASVFIVAVMVFAAFYLLPWDKVNWGTVQFANENTVTVTGYAKSQEKNEIAIFTAGVNAVNDDKDAAVSEVNSKIEKIISSVKAFGVEDKDVKTQNMSIYQSEEQYYDNDGAYKSRKGQWRVDNSIEIILRNIDRASEFATMLSGTDATNVFGPSFSIDDSSSADSKLIEMAIADAREKALVMAHASGRSLGKVLAVTEGGASSPVYRLGFAEGLGGGGVPVEPGSSTISKSVTVVFELR